MHIALCAALICDCLIKAIRLSRHRHGDDIDIDEDTDIDVVGGNDDADH